MALFEMLRDASQGYSWLGAVSLALSVALVLSLGTRLRQFRRLRHIDGPFIAAFSRLWLVHTVWSGRAYLDFWDVNRKYGMYLVCPLNFPAATFESRATPAPHRL